ncbi:MAG: hypothetical protein MZV70_25830 [Desulfobacterales bacterium]|nr:hypothetical protein [Desulfobacterales bacterium]
MPLAGQADGWTDLAAFSLLIFKLRASRMPLINEPEFSDPKVFPRSTASFDADFGWNIVAVEKFKHGHPQNTDIDLGHTAQATSCPNSRQSARPTLPR